MIRPLHPRDEGAWTAMRAALWPDATASDLAAETHAFVRGVPMPAIEAVFIADEGDAAVGFLELAVRPFSDGCESMPVPHVEAWYVEPQARGRGIGRALMAAAEGWATSRGFTELASDTELDNVASLRAHVRCGFAESERLIKFRKVLAPH